MMLLKAAETASEFGKAFSPERWSMAGQMTLLGMGMVFAVLAILWGVIEIFKLFFYTIPKKKKEKTEKSAPTEKAPEVPAVSPVPVPVAAGEDPNVTVAVITAAVAAYLAENEPTAYAGGFRVVSFRRTDKGSAWNRQ